MSKIGFIQIQRASEYLFYNDLDAYLVMTQIMYRALRRESKYNKHNLKVNQAEIGDYKSIGLTERRYRDAKHRIEHQYNLATFKGNNKGTIATLFGTDFCDINCEVSGQAPCKNTTDKRRTKDEQKDGQINVANNKESEYYKQNEEKKDEQKDGQKTDKGRTKDGPGTTKEECNNRIIKETTTPPTPLKGEPVVVALYDCLKENTDLSEDEKQILQQYEEKRVRLALDYAKHIKPSTTLIQMLRWHCKALEPPSLPTKPKTDQQKIAIEFNSFLLSVGQELMFEQNKTLINEGQIMTPSGSISLNNPVSVLRKDFDEIKRAYRQRKYG